jgi:hypothetical protein
MTWTRSPLRGALAGLALAGCATLCLPAPGRAEPPATEEAYRALKVDEQPALYVFLIDTSGSMETDGRYAAVRQSLPAFFAALAPTDQVATVVFAGDAVETYHGPAGESPDQLMTKVKLPARADGDNTDLGRAFEKAVSVLAGSDLPVASLVLLTDGKHRPQQGSRYKYTTGTSWNTLRARASTIKKESFLQYSIPLAADTDVALLQSVFPQARPLPVAAPGELNERLRVPKDASRREKARLNAAPDATATVDVGWPAGAGALHAGTNHRTLTLTARTRYIPLAATGLAVHSSDPKVHARLDTDQVALNPGETRQIGLTVEWDPGPPGGTPYDRRTVTADLAVAGQVDSPLGAVLAGELGVGLANRLTSPAQRVSGSAQRGRPWLWSTGTGVLFVLAVAVLLWLRRNPPLRGTLLASRGGTPLGAMALSGRRRPLDSESMRVAGTGQVRARKLAGTNEVGVRYTSGGTTVQRWFRSGGPPVIIHGVAFGWVDGDLPAEVEPGGLRPGHADPALAWPPGEP